MRCSCFQICVCVRDKRGWGGGEVFNLGFQVCSTRKGGGQALSKIFRQILSPSPTSGGPCFVSPFHAIARDQDENIGIRFPKAIENIAYIVADNGYYLAEDGIDYMIIALGVGYIIVNSVGIVSVGSLGFGFPKR